MTAAEHAGKSMDRNEKSSDELGATAGSATILAVASLLRVHSPNQYIDPRGRRRALSSMDVTSKRRNAGVGVLGRGVPLRVR